MGIYCKNKNQIPISPLNEEAMQKARQKWDAVAKPLNGLGDFEKVIVRIAGMTGNVNVHIADPYLAVMCADNGVVAEGVSQTGQEVTAQVAANIAAGTSSAGIMARSCGCGIEVVDVGMICQEEPAGVVNRKVAYGTADFARQPAMTEEVMEAAFCVGEKTAQSLAAQGSDLICAGEMGIGNTTTSAACAAALLHLDVKEVTGRGAGLDKQGLLRKEQVISDALQSYDLMNASWKKIVQTVGGLDICGLAGMMNEAAKLHLPVVLDGVITAVAALIAEHRAPGTKQYLIASHAGREPAMRMILRELGLTPFILGDMALGEGSGAVMLIPLLQMALDVYHGSSSFVDIHVRQYEHLENQ